MNLLFRFTLSNTIEGSLLIHEPEGWDDGTLKLERNENYHSLVEYYAQPLTFDDALGNGLPGGFAYIKNIEDTQGPDAQINILIELSADDGDSYENCFVGILDFDTLKEIDFYKLQCGVKRDDFWSKFINRKSIPVDLSSSIDLDGNARDVIESDLIALTSQKIRVKRTSTLSETVRFTESEVSAGDYIQIGFDSATLDEVREFISIPTGVNTSIPVWIVEALYAGEYTFDIRVEASRFNQLTIFPFTADYNAIDTSMEVYIKVNDDAPILFASVNDGDETEFTYNDTLSLLANDIIRVYCYVVDNAWKFPSSDDEIIIWGDLNNLSENLRPTHLDITADTNYPSTNSDCFRLKDAAESILSKLVGSDGVVLSDYLDGGCGDKYAITKGLNIRGWPIAEKPIFMDFDKWWNGSNPILNLGLGYEAGNKIRIEQKGFFYDKTSTSLNLSFINNIERSYAQEFIVKSIEIGYQKWSAESASGVDDPQSKRTWRSRFATIGKDEKIMSEFIAASLAIEQTRRNRVEQGKDWRLDEDVMIIAVDTTVSPITPEFDENFAEITGLLNSDARYNIRLSVARNFERWKEYFNGCLQWYLSVSPEEEYKFTSGEGNFDMTTKLFADDCEASGVSPEPIINEKGNVEVTDDFYFMPIMYDFEHPLSFEEYKLIRENRTKAIGISRVGSGHKKCFIMNLDYKPTRGLGTFTVILAENDPL